MAENATAMVRAGINAYKAGNKDEARNLLLKAVEADPYSEDGWLWLSGLLDSPDDQRTALENVLAINPTNDRARKGLDFLLGKSAPTPPPAAPPPAPSAPPPRAADVSTSVEWSNPADAARSAAQTFVPPTDPTHDVDYDKWVTDLNLPPQGPRPAVNIPAGGSLFISTEDDSTFDDTTFTDGPFNAAAIFEDDESSEAPVNTPAASVSSAPAFDVDDDDDYLPADAAAAIAAASAPLPKASPFAGVDLDAADDFEVRESGIRPAKQVDRRDRSAERNAERSAVREAKAAAKVAAKAERDAERAAQKAQPKPSKMEISEEDRLEMDADTRQIVESLSIIPREIEPTRVPGTHERQPILLVAAVIVLILLNLGAAVMLLNRILVPVSLG